MNASDVIRDLIIAGGSPEIKRELAEHANAALQDGQREEPSLIELEIAELSRIYAIAFTQARGGITKDMLEMSNRISYLKTLKSMGRRVDE